MVMHRRDYIFFFVFFADKFPVRPTTNPEAFLQSNGVKGKVSLNKILEGQDSLGNLISNVVYIRRGCAVR
jgi:hypothetical protein